jgi:hypothetical protein
MTVQMIRHLEYKNLSLYVEDTELDRDKPKQGDMMWWKKIR